MSRDLELAAAGLAVKWKKIVLDRGNSKGKSLHEAMRVCSGSSQEAGVSGEEPVRWEVMGEDFMERPSNKFMEGLTGLGGDLTCTLSERKRI